MSRARDFADLAGSSSNISTVAADSANLDQVASSYSAGGITGKNLIINGAMQVAARGTSFSSITGSTYTLDRFAVRDATAVSQSTDVPSSAGFKNSLFYDNAGTRGSINIRQVIEDATRLLNDTPCTLSFWAKGSTSASCSVDLADTNSTGFALTTGWVKYEITFPATSNLNSGNTYEAGAVWIDFNFGASYPDVYLTGIQLEVGEQATPFEHRSFGDELARCQRYYYSHADGASQSIGFGANYSSSLLTCQIHFPVTMRSSPTLVQGSGTDYYRFRRSNGSDLFNSFTATQTPSTNSVALDCNANISGTQGDGGRVQTENASAYIHFDSEL